MLHYKIDSSQLKIDLDNASIDDLLSSHRFISFLYLIPRPIFPPVRRMSRIYVIPKSTASNHLGLKYSIYNAIICWFGLPFSPIDMLSFNKLNRNGVDISSDIESRICLVDIKNGFIELPVYTGTFTQPSNPIVEEFKLILKDAAAVSSKTILGYVKHSGKHNFYLGVTVQSNATELSEPILDLFNKKFDGRSILQVVNLSVKGELQERLTLEGKSI